MLVLTIAGCDPDWPDHGKSAKVVGEITLDGAPLVNARIAFIPTEIKINGILVLSVFGTTDAQGKFTLKTHAGSQHITFDKYTVVISKVDDDSSPLGAKRELVPRIYNDESILTYELNTQEAFARPKFELYSTGAN